MVQGCNYFAKMKVNGGDLNWNEQNSIFNLIFYASEGKIIFNVIKFIVNFF